MPGKLCGVLAVQGAYAKHCASLARCGCPSIEVRSPQDLQHCDRLILPGGESTVMYRLLLKTGLWQSIQERITRDMPIFGTCAGMILLSRHVSSAPSLQDCGEQPCFQAIDLEVARNAYGRQIASFSTEIDLDSQKPENPQFQSLLQHSTLLSLPLIFIRAPKVLCWDRRVQVLLRCTEPLEPHQALGAKSTQKIRTSKQGGQAAKEHAVCLQQGRVLVCSFHPELSGSTLLHQYFLSL